MNSIETSQVASNSSLLCICYPEIEAKSILKSCFQICHPDISGHANGQIRINLVRSIHALYELINRHLSDWDIHYYFKCIYRVARQHAFYFGVVAGTNCSVERHTCSTWNLFPCHLSVQYFCARISPQPSLYFCHQLIQDDAAPHFSTY